MSIMINCPNRCLISLDQFLKVIFRIASVRASEAGFANSRVSNNDALYDLLKASSCFIHHDAGGDM